MHIRQKYAKTIVRRKLLAELTNQGKLPQKVEIIVLLTNKEEMVAVAILRKDNVSQQLNTAEVIIWRKTNQQVSALMVTPAYSVVKNASVNLHFLLYFMLVIFVHRCSTVYTVVIFVVVVVVAVRTFFGKFCSAFRAERVVLHN